MSKDAFAGNKNSQYDPGMVIKEVHDFYGQSIRVNNARSVADSYFTHFTASYNVGNNPTEVTYFRGTKAHVTNIGVISDVSGSLNNKYVLLRSSPDNNLYYIWLNVDGTGTDPLVSGAVGIEINISENDPATIISAAIGLVINGLFSKVFSAIRTGSTVAISTAGLGVCTDSSDFNTGFVVSNTQGSQVETDHILINYSGIDPVFGGQVLKGYKYNIWEGSFEFTASASFGAGLATEAKQDDQIVLLTSIASGISGGGLAPSNYDDVKIIRDTEEDPVSYKFYLSTSLIGQIDVIYNTSKSSIEYKKVL